jgi:ribosome-associated heat shock protein Hsp15
VRVGDVITVALDRSVRVLKVIDFAERRGAFAAARLLYEDLSPPAARDETSPPLAPARDAGAGRPTKRDRRAIERLIGPDDD